MNRFASGPKRHYYGKGDVIAYRLNRDGKAPAGGSPVFGANVLLLLYGDAFWKTYTEGDNSGLIATDSMKNFIQRETMNFGGNDLEEYCRFLGEMFLAKYAQVEGLQISASEIPYAPLGRNVAFAPSGPDAATARLEIDRTRHRRGGLGRARLQAAAARRQRVSRVRARRVHDAAGPAQPAAPHVARSRVDATSTPDAAFSGGAVTAQVRQIVRDVFTSFESGSIQQVIYQMGTRMLGEIPAICRNAPRSQQPHLGYDCGARRRAGRVHGRAAAVRVPWADAETDGYLKQEIRRSGESFLRKDSPDLLISC